MNSCPISSAELVDKDCSYVLVSRDEELDAWFRGREVRDDCDI